MNLLQNILHTDSIKPFKIKTATVFSITLNSTSDLKKKYSEIAKVQTNFFLHCQHSKYQIYKENGGFKVQANIELYSSKKQMKFCYRETIWVFQKSGTVSTLYLCVKEACPWIVLI
jgi:hypothetical protein